jgi:RNA polymerase primary sigma factor
MQAEYTEVTRFNYGSVMDTYDNLSAEEEQSLFRAYREGDESALEHIILSNIRLVHWVVNQHFRRADITAFDDLVQAGMQGLVKAAKKFDPDRNTRFSTYAVYYIRLYVKRFYKKDKIIKLPEHVYDDLGSIMDTGTTKRQLSRPNAQQRKMSALVNAANALNFISLDQEIGDDDSLTYGDIVADTAPPVEDIVSETDMQERLAKALNELGEKERQVCIMFYIEGRTQKEIGSLFNMSKARVYQIIKVATYKLRSIMERGYCAYADTEYLLETMKIYPELKEMAVDEFMEFVYNRFKLVVTMSVYRNAKEKGRFQ